MRFMKLAQQLLDALRIERPWHPSLIRGGRGQLPKRIKRRRNPVIPTDARQRITASRAVRRLLAMLGIPLTRPRRGSYRNGVSK